MMNIVSVMSDVEKNLGWGMGSNFDKSMRAFWIKISGFAFHSHGISLSRCILRESLSLN